MFALVTGGTGFIGSNLVERLLKKGWRVRVISRKEGSSKKIDWVNGDITDKDIIEKAMSGIDIVFNLAGTLPFHQLEEKVYWNTNVKGVKNILETCLTSKGFRRLIHISTVGIYGQSQNTLNEKSPFKLDSIYASTKAKGEKLVMDYYKKYKLPIVIIKPTIGYGPYDTRPGFLNLFTLIKKGLFLSLGNGQNFFHTIYVGNLIDALLLAASKKEAIGEDFIIGDEPCPKMEDILLQMAKITGTKLPPLYLPKKLVNILAYGGDILLKFGIKVPIYSQRVNFLTESRIYSIEKAKQVLGYKPRVDLESGLKLTYLWYQKEGLIKG